MNRSLLFGITAAVILAGCKSNSQGKPLPGVPEGGFKKLETIDSEPGTGPAAVKGDAVIVLYHGKRTDGFVFDYNMEENLEPMADKEPLTVTLGNGGVIAGWEEGLIGAKEGMVRTINVPWEKGYGVEGRAPSIPSKTDLIFKIKILKVMKGDGARPEIEVSDTKPGTGAATTLDSTVTFSYTGVSLSGKEFDKQDKLTVPVRRLIPGFKEAMIGMKAGGVRKMVFPPNSPNPTGRIPYSQWVTFTVTLHSVK